MDSYYRFGRIGSSRRKMARSGFQHGNSQGRRSGGDGAKAVSAGVRSCSHIDSPEGLGLPRQFPNIVNRRPIRTKHAPDAKSRHPGPGHPVLRSSQIGLPTVTFAIVGLMALWCIPATGQALLRTNPFTVVDFSKEFQVQSWTTERGLPQNTVTCVYQTHDGYIWFGTFDGLVRYDGIKFTVYDGQNTPAFHNNAISSLIEDGQGSLWIGTREGLVEYREHAFSLHQLSDQPPVYVRGLCVRKAGGLWLATDRGPARFQNGSGTFLANYPRYIPLFRKEKIGYGVTSVLEDAAGNLFVGDSRGLLELRAGRTDFEVLYSGDAEEHEDRNVGVGDIVEDGQGGVWFSNILGVYRWRAGELVMYPSAGNGLRGILNPVLRETNGALWLTCEDGGVSRLQDGRFTHFKLDRGWADPHVHCLLKDREGNLWAGTHAGGLAMAQPRRLRVLTTADGLANDDVWSISEAPDGSVWVGTSDGLSHFEHGVFHSHYNGLSPTAKFNVVCADRTGLPWTGCSRDLCRVTPNGLKSVLADFEGDQGHQLSCCESIYQDRSGAMWFGVGSLVRLKNGRWDLWGPGDGTKDKWHVLADPAVISVLEDSKADIWIGTKAGVCRLRDDKCDRYTRTNGFPADVAGPALADPDGTVWFASAEGLIRFKDGKFFLLGRQHGLFEKIVYNVLEDDFGWLWLNGNQGLQRLRKQDAIAVADGTMSRLHCLRYGEADGMLSAEGNGNGLPNSCKMRDGRLWFPTIKGIVIADPAALERSDVPPPVVIQNVTANGRRIFGEGSPADGSVASTAKFHGPVRLEPGMGNSLLIHYTANTFVAPERVRFQFKLEGQDKEWRDDDDNARWALYTNLRPGKYNFLVRAFNGHGVQSLSDAQFAFSVAPHFYERWAFYALCGCALLLCTASVHQVRMAGLRRIKELEQLHALDQERGRLARDMHDNLGADLTRVMMLAEVGKTRIEHGGDGASGTLEKIAGLSRAMVDGIGELVWATNPHKAGLEDVAAYLRARCSEILEPAGITSRYELPEELPKRTLGGEGRRQLLLAVKESLANILKHSHATEARLTLRITQDRLLLTIEDNGRGFSRVPNCSSPRQNGTGGQAPEGTERLPVSRAGGGNGLGNMENRLASVGGSCTIQSACGQGTSVVLEVPLAKAEALLTRP